MRLRVEFTTEPFDLDEAPAHAVVAREVIEAAELDAVDVGPFGNTAEGGADAVLTAVDALLRKTLEAGATRISLQVNVIERGPRRVTGAGDEPFIAAVKPLVDAMGGEMLPPDEAGPDDVVLAWEGADVVAVRLPQLADSLDHILAAMERRQGQAARRPGPQGQAGGRTDTGGARRLLRTARRGDRGERPRGQPLHGLQLPQPRERRPEPPGLPARFRYTGIFNKVLTCCCGGR